jgi:hypothetical protein
MVGRMKKMHLLVAVCAAVLFVAGCKKTDQAKPADNGPAAPAAKTTDQPAAPTPAPAATPTAPTPSASGGGAIASTADYEAKGTDMMDKLTAIFTSDGKDCDKLASDVGKFIADHKADFDTVGAYEKAHPADKKAFDAKTKDKQKVFMDTAGPALEACKSNKALGDALAKMPD